MWPDSVVLGLMKSWDIFGCIIGRLWYDILCGLGYTGKHIWFYLLIFHESLEPPIAFNGRKFNVFFETLLSPLCVVWEQGETAASSQQKGCCLGVHQGWESSTPQLLLSVLPIQAESALYLFVGNWGNCTLPDFLLRVRKHWEHSKPHFS